MVNENQPVMYIALTDKKDFDAALKGLQEHKVIAIPYTVPDGRLAFRKISIMTAYRTQ